MAKKIVLIIEYGNGGYSYYNDEPISKYASQRHRYRSTCWH